MKEILAIILYFFTLVMMVININVWIADPKFFIGIVFFGFTIALGYAGYLLDEEGKSNVY